MTVNSGGNWNRQTPKTATVMQYLCAKWISMMVITYKRSWHSIPVRDTMNNLDIVEAHCYFVDIGRIDREQIRSRINNNDCRTFRPRRPLSTVYTVDKGLRGRNVLQSLLLILLRICSRSIRPIWTVLNDGASYVCPHPAHKMADSSTAGWTGLMYTSFTSHTTCTS